MAKQGMKRPQPERKKNDIPPVPEIQGKAKLENDLAEDNLFNDWDMTGADIQDFRQK